MPALAPTDFVAIVTWLGRVADRRAGITAAPVAALGFGFEGPEGEAHGGLTRPACARVATLYPRGTPVRNVRQVSIVAAEELAATAAAMGIDAIDPAWIGATMVVQGIPDFTAIPPSSRLQAEGGVTLTVDMENRACVQPGRAIDCHRPGFGARYKGAAQGRRGVTAWVEREGVLRRGERLRLHVPVQREWPHLAGLRGMV